jgi:hypothetical protein
MFDRTVLVLGAFKLEAVVMAPGETCVEALGDRAIAVMLVSGQARCNGVALERWRQVPVTRSCCLEAAGGLRRRPPGHRRQRSRPPRESPMTARSWNLARGSW